MSIRLSYRAVFISDVHLGALSSRADEAATFLKHVDCQTLYLVGDIIDMWRLRSRWYWPECHNRFVRRVLKLSKLGTRVVFIPGNHDEHAREYTGLNFGGVEIARDAVHTTADGRRFLVTHGDQADMVVRHARLLSVIGGTAYDGLVVANRWANRVRARLGRKPWSLSQAIKGKVKKACQHIARYEETLIAEARDRNLDGVICGHIHKAELRALPCGLTYVNCGDWVESLTAAVEHDDGIIRVVSFHALLDGVLEEDRPLPAHGEHAPRPSQISDARTFSN